MRKNFRILVDCDDTLYHCNLYAIKKLNQEKGTNFKLIDVNSWGLTGTLIDERLKYYDDPEFMKSLPLMDGAKEFISELSKRAEVIICTNVKPQCAGVRIQSILDNFPEIEPGNIIIGGRKDTIIADMMLDDCILNLQNSNTDYPVLFQQPWNNNNAGMLSVNGYEEFINLVDIIKSSKDNNRRNYELISLIGPSGSGKNTIADKLIDSGVFKRVKTYSTKRDGDYQTLSLEQFLKMNRLGYFSETSVYMGEYFGVCNDDINQIIEDGYIPFILIDVNGAVSLMNKYNCLNVFVKESKEQCIKNILEKDLSIEEKTTRLLALDSELKNEELCDISVSNNNFETILKIFGREGKR